MLIAVIILSCALLAAIAIIVYLWGRNTRLDERLRQCGDADTRFAAIADKALAANAETLMRHSNQSLADVLTPMKADLESFRNTVAESYNREARERYALGERVRELVQLNQTIGAETRRLTDAIKGNARMQGAWGEMILDNILERAGFRRGYEYEVQKSVIDADGRRMRPDVVINYTEGRRIVIDSKVSIQDYFGMLDAPDDATRTRYAKAHLASVRKHVAELNNKQYNDIVGDSRFDYVLMFIPHEGAFLAAMNLDSTLWETAYDSHVIIISPAHLMSIVKLIEQMWRHDKQNRNAIAIADEAGKMLDKFRAFLDDMDRIDKSLGTARTAWDDAFRKLTAGTGNLISRAEKLQSLGAKARKPLSSRYTSEE